MSKKKKRENYFCRSNSAKNLFKDYLKEIRQKKSKKTMILGV